MKERLHISKLLTLCLGCRLSCCLGYCLKVGLVAEKRRRKFRTPTDISLVKTVVVLFIFFSGQTSLIRLIAQFQPHHLPIVTSRQFRDVVLPPNPLFSIMSGTARFKYQAMPLQSPMRLGVSCIRSNGSVSKRYVCRGVDKTLKISECLHCAFFNCIIHYFPIKQFNTSSQNG